MVFFVCRKITDNSRRFGLELSFTTPDLAQRAFVGSLIWEDRCQHCMYQFEVRARYSSFSASTQPGGLPIEGVNERGR